METAAGSPTPPGSGPLRLAAVDLGSNSFRLLLADVVDGHLRPVESLREGVRLAASLGPDGRLDDAGQARALEALGRFGQLVRELPPDRVRAVGTNTLRKARDAGRFLAAAERALGHPVEVVSGAEEARLVFVGVAYAITPGGERRLVVDIGGGSTECIVGRGAEPERVESLFMGCVSHSGRFFPGGRVDARAWKRAELAAARELAPIAASFRRAGWERALGSSGTVKAIAAVARQAGWSDGRITRRVMRRLKDELIAAGEVRAARLPGLSEDRIAVLPGGAAILRAVFRSLKLESIEVSPGALREGVLWDLLGRVTDRDLREDTVAALAGRYGADALQAEQVSATALALFDQVRVPWRLTAEDRRVLRWAARLHEIGRAVSHIGYHKHGEYLLRNGDMPGFSRQDQQAVALLVRAHRRKIPAELVAGEPAVLRLALLLRLAALLHRGRNGRPAPSVRIEVSGPELRLVLPAAWLARRPLTTADLEEESQHAAGVGHRLAWEAGGRGPVTAS